MKINGGVPPEKPDGVKFHKVSKKSDQASDTGREAVADKVDVSGRAREIAELTGVVKSIPDTREGKVAEIKDLVDSGKYVADPYKIAGKMLNEVI
ncbi:MAG: flagellar biosynthesis anti-sigma factor FlgM [Syntrophorhabdaceae bacterium]|nr:flagellar biosynthesis anti-sigma factor FlgM [Syntrophorhabdaceae bacterium]